MVNEVHFDMFVYGGRIFFFLASKSLAFDALNNILLLIIDADYPISRTPAILQLKVNVLSYHPQKLPSKHTQNSPKFGLLFKQTTIVQPGSHRFVYIWVVHIFM